MSVYTGTAAEDQQYQVEIMGCMQQAQRRHQPTCRSKLMACHGCMQLHKQLHKELELHQNPPFLSCHATCHNCYGETILALHI